MWPKESGADFSIPMSGFRWVEPDAVLAERINVLKPYQVNAQAMEMTGNPHVKFMHCLPAFHNADTKVGKEMAEKFGLDDGVEVTEKCLNRRLLSSLTRRKTGCTIKAVMVATLGD